MRPELPFNQVALRELFALKKQAQNPEELVPDVDGRLLNLLLAVFVRTSEQLDILLRHFS